MYWQNIIPGKELASIYVSRLTVSAVSTCPNSSIHVPGGPKEGPRVFPLPEGRWAPVCPALSSPAQACPALSRLALPGPARRPRLLRRRRTGWIGGARGRRGAGAVPSGARCLLARPRRAALAPWAGVSDIRTAVSKGKGVGGVRKDFRSCARSRVRGVFPPYCACLNACLARCFPPDPSKIPTGGSGVAWAKEGGEIPALSQCPGALPPRRAACRSHRGEAQRARGAGAGRCRPAGQTPAGMRSQLCTGADPSHSGRFRWGRWNAEVATQNCQKTVGFLARSMPLRKINK